MRQWQSVKIAPPPPARRDTTFKWKENSERLARERCHLFSVLALEQIRKQMGQGRSEGHATADSFVYLACLWYPASNPAPPTARTLLTPDLEVTTGGSRPLFTRDSILPGSLTTQANSKHMGRVWAYYSALTRTTIGKFVLARLGGVKIL